MAKRNFLAALFVLLAFGVISNFGLLTSLAMSLNSGGVDENLYLNPSGVGRVVIGGASIVVASASDDPTTNRPGQIYFNTDVNEFRGYDGNSWAPLGPLHNTGSIDFERSSQQYLSINDGSQSGLDVTGDMTVEGWINLESLPADGDGQRIVQKRVTTGNQRSYYFGVANSGGLGLLFTVSDDGVTDVNKSVSWSPSAGVWYHIAVVYDASEGSVDFYVNGEHQGSQQTGLPTSVYNSTAPFVLGDSGDYFDGKIDDVRVYSRTRYAAEVAADFNRELLGDERGLVGYWKLDSTLSDSTQNGNNLTNNNSATFSADRAF